MKKKINTNAVRQVLLNVWNPVGISGVPDDEYDDYLNAVIHFMDTNNWEGLRTYLVWVERYMFSSKAVDEKSEWVQNTIGALQLVALGESP